MSLFVLEAVKKKYPDSQIDFIVHPESAVLVKGHPSIHQVYIVPSDQVKSSSPDREVSELLEVMEDFIEGMMTTHYQLSLNLNQEYFCALIHGLISSDKKIGFTFSGNNHFQVEHRMMEHLFAIPVDRSRNPFHVVDVFKQTFWGEGIPPSCAKLPPLPDVDKGMYPHDLQFIVFQIGSAWMGKRWPLKYWAVLLQSLSQHFPIVFVGSTEELKLWNDLITCLPSNFFREKKNVYNAMGKTTLLESATLIKKAKLLITGDTVAMHLGAVCQTKTIALFGASNPVETGPYGEGHFVFQTSIEVKEQLPLGVTSEGLEKIKPHYISDFVLKGFCPSDVSIWETGWNKETCRWELKGKEGELHPFQKENINICEKEGDCFFSEANKGLRINKILQEVISHIENCMINLTSENLFQLQEADRQWAEITSKSLLWEAYRIALNGLPMDNLQLYLRKRKERLWQAVEEEKASYQAAISLEKD